MGKEEKEKEKKEEEEQRASASVPVAPVPQVSKKMIAEEEKEKIKTVKNTLKQKLDEEDSDCTRDAKKVAEQKAMAVARKLQHDSASQMFKPLMEEASSGRKSRS